MTTARISPQAFRTLSSDRTESKQRKESALTRKPEELKPEALHGIAGEVVDRIFPNSESGKAALLIQFLAAAGIYIGRTTFFRIEGDRHYTNLNALIIGNTSKGRKGTSWGQVRRLLGLVDPHFIENNVKNGVSSGEGLIWAVRDPISKDQPSKRERSHNEHEAEPERDPGVLDKRLLIQESEFARVLKTSQQVSNCASAVIREAWDSGKLSILTKNNPAKATGAHIGIIGHITIEELKRLLTSTEVANGFANRFLWIYTERSKLLPEGGSLADDDLAEFAERLREIAGTATEIGCLRWNPEALALWRTVYGGLSEGKPGLFGAIIGRAEAQVLRLATLYATLDSAMQIRPEHLRAALAVWDYAEDSARYTFGDAIGDETADIILRNLRVAGNDGASRTEISKLFSGNKPAAEIDRALRLLANCDHALSQRIPHEPGRPEERWYLRQSSDEINEKDEEMLPRAQLFG